MMPQVYVRINEKDAPYHMKVGDTGEAFFVFETDQDVPEDLQTSPITGPMSDNEAGNEVRKRLSFLVCRLNAEYAFVFSPNCWISATP